MKYFKYLVMLLVVSSITCLSGIKANSTDPYIYRMAIGPHNAGAYTDIRQKETDSTQELRYVKVDRELDVILRDKDGNNMSNWYVLNTGDDVIFGNNNARYAGHKYKIYIDSRILYTQWTDVYLKWWIH